MAQIDAFRGWRYAVARVGELSNVVAPPYDVISPELQQSLYGRSPHNVVRLILNRREPGEGEREAHERAAGFLQQWQREGVLVRDREPSISVYHQVFEQGGKSITRRGFLCRVLLEPFGEGRIFPHEKTHARVREERLNLTRATRMNLSPVFGFYPDDANELQDRLEAAVDNPTPLVATDHLGVVHKIWQVTRPDMVSQASACMAERPIYIADGHHRYETACAYRAERRGMQGRGEVAPFDYVLMFCVATGDPGLVIQPTHRLFRGIPPLGADELQRRLSPAFDLIDGGRGPEAAEDVWSVLESGGSPSTLGLYLASDETWRLAELTEAGERMMERVAASQSRDWRRLGVALLHELIVTSLLEQPDLPPPRYAHTAEEVCQALIFGDVAGRDATGQIGREERFQLAALVPAASVDDICRVAAHGERMPAKSTYFYPKVLSGLVFNSLDG